MRLFIRKKSLRRRSRLASSFPTSTIEGKNEEESRDGRSPHSLGRPRQQNPIGLFLILGMSNGTRKKSNILYFVEAFASFAALLVGVCVMLPHGWSHLLSDEIEPSAELPSALVPLGDG